MIDAIISSPPYSETHVFTLKTKRIGDNKESPYKQTTGNKAYGKTKGQLGTMTGNFADVLKGLKMPKKTKPILVTNWQGCYDGNWKGIITEESFQHPAKYAKGLVDRILQHLFEEGWVERGSTVCDPFGGVGTGGILCAYKGLKWVGCELEEKFVGLGNQNFDLHRRKWKNSNLSEPVLLQGDSRKLCEVISAAKDDILSSPPFQQSLMTKDEKFNAKARPGRRDQKSDYGESQGQLGNMKGEGLDAVLSSPPYAEVVKGSNKERETAEHSLKKRKSKGGCEGQSSRNFGYGTSNGNVSNLKEGTVDSVVSSPPYEGSLSGGEMKKEEEVQENMRKKGYSEKTVKKVTAHVGGLGYGVTEGNVGQEIGETFWHAARDIVLQCFQILKPGGVAVWVCKDFVRNKERVPFSDDWLKLCLACGFVPVCRHRALLTKGTKTNMLGETTHKKERKSFFRRLIERKGSPRIDHEDVICVRKPE